MTRKKETKQGQGKKRRRRRRAPVDKHLPINRLIALYTSRKEEEREMPVRISLLKLSLLYGNDRPETWGEVEMWEAIQDHFP